LAQGDGFAVYGRGYSAKEFKSFCAGGGVNVESFLEGFAGVQCLQLGEFAVAGHDDVGGFAQVAG